MTRHKSRTEAVIHEFGPLQI